MTLTPDQIRALAWLPLDGHWDEPGEHADALNSGAMRNFVECKEWSSRHPLIYRLTPAGQAERARLVEEGRIER